MAGDWFSRKRRVWGKHVSAGPCEFAIYCVACESTTRYDFCIIFPYSKFYMRSFMLGMGFDIARWIEVCRKKETMCLAQICLCVCMYVCMYTDALLVRNETSQ